MTTLKPVLDLGSIGSLPTAYFKGKKIIVFDLDMTLTESKTPMDNETTKLMEELLRHRDVAVIGGGLYAKFQEQLINQLKIDKKLLARLYVFPTCATAFYRFIGNEWKQIYANNLSESQKRKIVDAFQTAFRECRYSDPKTIYGPTIEDRGTQISFSPLGQQAPAQIKRDFATDPKIGYQETRMKLKAALERLLPEFQVAVGGYTTIDITQKGIDKAYGIKKISEILKYKIEEMLYIGDALFEGGNDYPARLTGVDCIQVKDYQETKLVIKRIIESFR